MSEAAEIQNPDDATIKSLLESMKTVAVVGFSANPNRPSHGISRFLDGLGLRVIGVNPGLAGQNILGLEIVASLNDIDVHIDVVDVFRRSDAVPEIITASITAGAKSIWMQEGVVHEEAAAEARAAGLEVVQDLCIYKEWLRLINA
ncbi:MAG: putative CoA-binding protein [Candidatus Krumholzibacteriia bacterium]|jgi:predicted CoA-binding protein